MLTDEQIRSIHDYCYGEYLVDSLEETDEKIRRYCKQVLADLTGLRRQLEAERIQWQHLDQAAQDAREEVAALRRQLAEAQAKLDAVPMDDIQRMQGCEAHTERTEWAKIRVSEWLAKNGRRGMWPPADIESTRA